jgi:hypothetical protein
VIPELPEIISGFASCYPKFPNKIRVSGISGSGSGIPGSGFGLRVFCPALAKTSMGWLWHRRLAHVGMKNLHKLLKGEHVLGLTNVFFEKDRPCAACQAGKQVGRAHHSKNVMTTSRTLELLHMDLFRPVAYLSIGGSMV